MTVTIPPPAWVDECEDPPGREPWRGSPPWCEKLPPDPFPADWLAEPSEPQDLVAGDLARWAGLLADARAFDLSTSPDEEASAAYVTLITGLERLKAAASAAQARVSERFDLTQRRLQEAEGVPARKLGQGIGAQVALARHESPVKGGRFLGAAQAWVREMPHTLAALSEGRLNEWRATLAVRETACLSVEDRQAVDEEFGRMLAKNPAMGDRAVVAGLRRLVVARDAEAFVRRAEKAVKDRRVTCRPAPDGMAYVTALLPLREGVAVFAALGQGADAARAAGDERGRGQLMADTLVERVTGRAVEDPVDVHLDIVITDRALFGEDDTAADVVDHGPVPAPWVRRLLERVTDPQERVQVRRIFRGPGALLATETAGRYFTPVMQRLIRIRDQHCRTPWCDAPIRHGDHVVDHAEGGPTSLGNGQGLCEHCNHTKQLPGWRAGVEPGPEHRVRLVTPTGHAYTSHPPAGPGQEAGH